MLTRHSENPNAALLAQALSFHQYNHLPQACSLYRKILAEDPRHPEALHMLGVALMQQGKHNDGIELIRDALEQNPTPAMWLNLGSGLAHLQRHEDAIVALNQALELAPDNAEALNNLGVALAATGRHEDALRQFGLALQLRCDFAACHSNRANSLRGLHRINDAIHAAELAVHLQPENADSLNSLGMALAAALREEEALQRFDRALQITPAHGEALANRARLLRRRQRFAEALADYTLLISLQPHNPHAHNDIGLTFYLVGRHFDALAHFDTALAFRPDIADLHNNRGNTLVALGRVREALGAFEQALVLAPQHVEALNNKANTLLALGEAKLALPLTEKVCRLASGLPQGHNNRGLALAGCHRHAEALDAFDQALVLRERYPEALNNRGQTLEALGQPQAALRDYSRALTYQPEHPLALWNKAQAHLRMGDFAAGWSAYKARHSLPGAPLARELGIPEWRGEPLAGRSILLWAEQAPDATILFCRFAAQLAKHGAKVYLELPAQMEQLLSSLEGVHQVIRYGNALPDADFHCALPDLPAKLYVLATSIPADVPYLRGPAARLDFWRTQIPPHPFRIAFVCSGGSPSHTLPDQNLGLADLAPLLECGVRIHLVQKDFQPDDATGQANHPGIIDLRSQLGDYADLAAALCCMDLVIGTDSATIHLAGALNRPTWVLLQVQAEWYWQLGREDSPWYPQARLFRQHAAGDWRKVMGQVAQALRHYCT